LVPLSTPNEDDATISFFCANIGDLNTPHIDEHGHKIECTVEIQRSGRADLEEIGRREQAGQNRDIFTQGRANWCGD
jgi:hypothetical protein